MNSLDSIDKEIIEKTIINRDSLRKKYGPLQGDWIKFSDCSYERFCNNMGDTIQTCYGGSFHLFKHGEADHSGGLNGAISKAEVIPTEETKPAEFWIFHHGEVRAHNGVNFEINTPVYGFTGDESKQYKGYKKGQKEY